LENVRCFNERQRIDFSDGNGKPKQWTILLGDNGTGKTTLLESLSYMIPSEVTIPNENNHKKVIFPRYAAIGKQDESISNFVNSKYGLSKISPNLSLFEGEIGIFFYSNFFLGSKLSEKGSGEIHHTFVIHTKKGISTFYELNSNLKNIFCFAYGASRKAGATSISEQNEESAYITLFDETALLINPEEWILQADYASKRKTEFKDKREKELEFVKDILIKVLPDIDEIRFSEKDDENKRISTPIVEFHTPYGWVESKDLSLGYRTSMAWMVDFASRMFDRYPESENPLAEPAVVLIDEIDLHLHPKWQRELIDYLTNLFPNTQFIVTTHSPLIVQAAAARDANIVVCRREGDHVVIDQSVEAVKNWRTDQILTSDLFDLPTTRPKEIEPFLEERQKILSKAKLTKKDEKRLEELEGKIGFVPVMENPKYDEAMDIILRAAEKLGKENGISNDSHKKASKSSGRSKK
jgi:AAA15 family ATPase/GTPase